MGVTNKGIILSLKGTSPSKFATLLFKLREDGVKDGDMFGRPVIDANLCHFHRRDTFPSNPWLRLGSDWLP